MNYKVETQQSRQQEIGLCSSLVARRAIRDYLVDSRGTGFAAALW